MLETRGLLAREGLDEEKFSLFERGNSSVGKYTVYTVLAKRGSV